MTPHLPAFLLLTLAATLRGQDADTASLFKFELEPGGVQLAATPLRLPGQGAVPWATARYLVGDVLHEGDCSGTLRIEFFAAGEDKSRIQLRLGLLPGLPSRFCLPLHCLDGQTFFLERQLRCLKGVMPGSRLEKDQVAAVTLAGEGTRSLRLSDLRLCAERPAPLPALGSPVVDELGQWTAREWPGKTRSVEAMVQDLGALHAAVKDAAGPAGRSAYGGDSSRRFEATGFFRVERDDRRWWLVDPDGCAFFSVGMDCVGPASAGPVTGMADLFTWLPPDDGPFAAAWVVAVTSARSAGSPPTWCGRSARTGGRAGRS